MLEAASRAGARRVVLCSSDSVLGNTVWKERFFLPDELPVDETHRLRPSDPYGLSELMAEEAGRSFAARGALEVLALRPVFVLFPSMMGEVRERAVRPGGLRRPLRGRACGGERRALLASCRSAGRGAGLRAGGGCAVSGVRGVLSGGGRDAAAGADAGGDPGAVRAVAGAGRWKLVRGRPFAPMFDTRRAAERLGWRPEHDRRAAVFGDVEA